MGRKNRGKASLKVGLPPGAAVYVGEPRTEGITVSALAYDASGCAEHQHASPTQVRALVGERRVVWLDCDGVHDPAIISEICTTFEVHPLAVEHILDTRGRAKLDGYENGQVVFAINMVTTVGERCELLLEHVTFVLGPGFVLSFQEGRSGDLFDAVRQRIRSGIGRIRTMGPDYLLHALIDAIVDECFVVVDRFEEQIDRIETEAFKRRPLDLPARIYAMKGDLATLRRTLFPLREPVSRLLRGETSGISRSTEPYWRDLHDHVVQVLEMADAGSDRLSSVLDTYLALATHRLNDVMKVLTIVSTIFIPLSWLAGVYGMNFDHMPELHWVYGYPLAMGTMIVTALIMLAWFRRSGWI